MPPPVAVPRDVPAPDLPAGTPVAGHPATEPDGRVPSTSLAHVAALVRAAVPPMHPGGRPIVAGVAAAAGLVRVAHRPRRPRRRRWPRPPSPPSSATRTACRRRARASCSSPADGTVALVSEVVPPPELDLPRVPAPRVSVFLSVLDVHVQRIPVDGRVRRRRSTGPAASCPPTSTRPARTTSATRCCWRPSTAPASASCRSPGLLARRIVCDVGPGDEVAAGETYGLIRFGSRVDTYLPAGSTVTVEVGQRTIGGETVLAELAHSRARRTGVA